VLGLYGANVVLRRLSLPLGRRRAPPWWDLPARAAATAVLVLVVTGLATALGPIWIGVLAPFPIALSVVCGFTAARDGHGAVVALLRGVVPGLNGFALFCYTVAVCNHRLDAAAAFSLATAVALVFALVLAAQARTPW